MSTNMNRRLTAIEEAMATELQSCSTCEDWPTIFIRLKDEMGAFRTPDNVDTWPAETATCPNCGREPGNLITIARDPRGPQ